MNFDSIKMGWDGPSVWISFDRNFLGWKGCGVATWKRIQASKLVSGKLYDVLQSIERYN